MVADDELVMISALQHYCFCPRQCALIHVEEAWRENYLTAAGRLLHERVDRRGSETRGDIKTVAALRLVSRRLGVTGIADMVELHRADGVWRAYPVEYKHGRPKAHRADEVQLCAQAMALEEMRGEEIVEGALFYGAVRRRMVVRFDRELRRLTEATARAVHELIDKGEIPPAVYSPACEACSVYEVCRPREFNGRISAKDWTRRIMEAEGL
ncbi:MAG: CRISPR-associated protein Cas4 [Kiritimatiellia bacterium]